MSHMYIYLYKKTFYKYLMKLLYFSFVIGILRFRHFAHHRQMEAQREGRGK